MRRKRRRRKSRRSKRRSQRRDEEKSNDPRNGRSSEASWRRRKEKPPILARLTKARFLEEQRAVSVTIGLCGEGRGATCTAAEGTPGAR